MYFYMHIFMGVDLANIQGQMTRANASFTRDTVFLICSMKIDVNLENICTENVHVCIFTCCQSFGLTKVCLLNMISFAIIERFKI